MIWLVVWDADGKLSWFHECCSIVVNSGMWSSRQGLVVKIKSSGRFYFHVDVSEHGTKKDIDMNVQCFGFFWSGSQWFKK